MQNNRLKFKVFILSLHQVELHQVQVFRNSDTSDKNINISEQTHYCLKKILFFGYLGQSLVQ